MNSIVCIQDIEDKAYSKLPRDVLHYFRKGAGHEGTLQNNRNAFAKLRIRPTFMRDVSKRNLSSVILGETISIPIGVAPTALQKLAHPAGECASDRAAEAMGTIFILSTMSTCSIEEVAKAASNAFKWFQLDLTESFIKRAENAGFKALVVTVDVPVFGLRHSDLRSKFSLPSHLTLANFAEKEANIRKISDAGIMGYGNDLLDPSVEWNDIAWLQNVTTLPIILKGILTADDAIQAADMQVAGIIVCNHGARQMDSVPASIDALPEIVKAVEHRVEVYLDSGVREGTDVFKALVLGAKMVFVGWPALCGLVYDGEEGVRKVLGMLRDQLDNTLALTVVIHLKQSLETWWFINPRILVCNSFVISVALKIFLRVLCNTKYEC